MYNKSRPKWQQHGGVAQLARACGSYPQCHWFDSNRRYQLLNIRPGGQAVKTRPFHGCNMGSIPVRVTINSLLNITGSLFLFSAFIILHIFLLYLKKKSLYGRIAQLVRAFASHARGLGFESQCVHQIKKSHQTLFDGSFVLVTRIIVLHFCVLSHGSPY